MKKETLREKIWDLTMLYSTAREEGDDEEHKLVVNEILQLVEEERQKWVEDLLKKIDEVEKSGDPWKALSEIREIIKNF